jgi:SAM-dependent methyltransferase
VSWDPVWEEVYRSQAWGKYPPEELIRFVARRFYGVEPRSGARILDVGCGPGAGVWYLAREGFDTHGVDGSPTAIAQAGERLAAEGLAADLRIGDLRDLTELYPASSFDAVVDVTSVQHNSFADVLSIHDGITQILRSGGRVFAIVLARGSWGDGLGRELEPGTFTDISEGPLRGKGVTHFATLEEVERIFARYEDVEVNRSERTLDHGRHSYAHWVVEGTRT